MVHAQAEHFDDERLSLLQVIVFACDARRLRRAHMHTISRIGHRLLLAAESDRLRSTSLSYRYIRP